MSRVILNIEIIDEIANAFLEAGFETEEKRLLSFKHDLLSEQEEIRIKAALNIISYSQPKVWGDLAVYGKCKAYNTLQEWDAALAKLTNAAKKVRKK
ncbi:hypothetical protein [Photobacterium halotolerans]|uniref:Uncharacterized protein n=1 Tax=Photobacterium halotolerans TaxID=265726 RepID=A0A0F5VCH3_9GAMM|nr:hypothetical protein [Photobacterium halotolerans]KKC99501.1 hypothetical protein KY46_12700 [Photobacterium halotolerans]